MKRRTAIKAVALSLGSAIALPAWASGWQATTLGGLSPADNDVLLASLADTFIPTTATPGAKDLGVHLFIRKMVQECYDTKTQDNFNRQLGILDQMCTQLFGRPFAEAETSDRLELLKIFAKSKAPETREFYGLLRGLTLHGYTSSEHYMTHFTDYEMAPARFYGCVPVKK